MLVKYVLGYKTLVEFTDIFLDRDNLSTFKRIIKNQTFYFIDGQLDYKEKLNTFSFIKNLNPRAFLNNDFITMDSETINIDGHLSPYAGSIYDGKQFTFFYLSDYAKIEDMLIDAIRYLMQRKYDSYKVYLHNFSKFDGVFLIKEFSTIIR